MAGERIILGLESSCDDTAAALIRARPRPGRGRDPRLARCWARTRCTAPSAAWCPRSPPAPMPSGWTSSTEAALAGAGLGLGDIDAVAVTAGPGLIGGVLAGVMFAKGLAAGRGLPLYGVNHLAGHALTPRLVDGRRLSLPDAAGLRRALPVAGRRGRRRRFLRLGGTIDDAPGEAFDKVAKLLGLGQPGGPAGRARGARRAIPPLRPCRGRCSTGPAATSPSPG